LANFAFDGVLDGLESIHLISGLYLALSMDLIIDFHHKIDKMFVMLLAEFGVERLIASCLKIEI
jgi:hypothetical protein